MELGGSFLLCNTMGLVLTSKSNLVLKIDLFIKFLSDESKGQRADFMKYMNNIFGAVLRSMNCSCLIFVHGFDEVLMGFEECSWISWIIFKMGFDWTFRGFMKCAWTRYSVHAWVPWSVHGIDYLTCSWISWSLKYSYGWLSVIHGFHEVYAL